MKQVQEKADRNHKTNIEVLLMALGVVFIAANLRAPITSVGPVVKEISEYLNLSNIQAGMITTIPLLAFALLSGFVPKVSRKLGMKKFLLFSLLLIY